jgi:hypothetical protein
MFVVDFSLDTSEYPAYDWTTSAPGTYEATSVACQLPSKSENPETEGALLPTIDGWKVTLILKAIGYLQRTTHFITLPSSFTDGCAALPDSVQPYLFAQQDTSLPCILANGGGPSESSGPLASSSTMIMSGARRANFHTKNYILTWFAMLLGSAHPTGNPSWQPGVWNTFESKPLAPAYPSPTVDPRCTFAGPLAAILPEHHSSKSLEAALHPPLLSVPDSQSSVQTSTYASDEEELEAIRNRIRAAPFMTSSPQCMEPTVGSPDDHYTGGRGIAGKSIFTAFVIVLANGEYQCIKCTATYKKLERAIGDQAKHFGFKPYICIEKHDGRTVWCVCERSLSGLQHS